MISGCFHPYPCILCRDNRDNRDSITGTRMVEREMLSRLGVRHGEMAGQVPGHAGTVCRRTWHLGPIFLSRLRAFASFGRAIFPLPHPPTMRYYIIHWIR